MTAAQEIARGGQDNRRADPYTVFWQTDDGPGALEVTLDQLSGWLRERGIDLDLQQDHYERTANYRFICLHHQADWRHDFQAQLVEHNDRGTWTTELTLATTEREGGWLRIVVSSSEGIFVGTPRIAGYLLGSGLFRDGGSLRLTPSPKHVHLNEVEELAEVLTDVGRRGLAFVAGSDDDMSFDDWMFKVTKWTRDVTGLGEVFVLDPLATAALSQILGTNFAVKPHTIRTYRPGVDPALSHDAGRHRYLSRARLEGSSVRGIASLLGRIAREHNAARPLPDSAKAVFRAFGRIESKVLAQSIAEVSSRAGVETVSAEPTEVTVESTPVIAEANVEAATAGELVTEIEGYARDVALVRRVLGIDVISEENLSRVTRPLSIDADVLDLFQQELNTKQDAVDALEDELSQLTDALFDAQVNLDVESDARSRAEDEVRWLRSELADNQQWDVAYGVMPDAVVTDYPESFEDLVDRLQVAELPGVMFTGDRSSAEELDGHYDVRTAVRGAWDACLALADYVRYRAGGNHCNVHMYLQNASSEYRKVPLTKYASTESDSVVNNPKWSDQRCFPVPTAVESSGWVHMFAHFKCARVGMVSPRLHYFDDFSRTGKVYIGYIGRHLPNTQTN